MHFDQQLVGVERAVIDQNRSDSEGADVKRHVTYPGVERLGRAAEDACGQADKLFARTAQ